MKYWLWINGSQQGPFDIQEIRDKLANGLSPLTLFIPSQGPGDWGPLSSLTGLSVPIPQVAQPATPTNPPTSPAVPISSSAYKIEEPGIAQTFAIIAAFEFVASPIVGLLIGSNDQKLGFLIFIGGMLNGLFFSAFSHIITYLHATAERLRFIEMLLKNKP